MMVWLNVIVGAVCMPVGLLLANGDLWFGRKFTAKAVEATMHLNTRTVRLLRGLYRATPVVYRWLGRVLAVAGLASFVGGLAQLVGAVS
jgi:uncharacterized protein YneF (UPF0154 family)